MTTRAGAAVGKTSGGVMRAVFTILMYAGVAVFCVPYLVGRVDGLEMYQVGGAMAAVICGLMRCYWSDEECWWHVRS